MSIDAQYYKAFLTRPADHTVDDWFHCIDTDEDVRAFFNKCKTDYETEQTSKTAPGPGQYRSQWPVSADKCLARHLRLPYHIPEEQHLIGYSPAVYMEHQCLKPRSHGKDLCHSCDRVFKKETEIGKFKRWNGYMTEEPLDSSHMLGTAWGQKCKWTKH